MVCTSLRYIFYLYSYISCYWYLHTEKLSLKKKPLAEEIRDPNFILPSLKAITQVKSLGLFGLRAPGLLSFLLEVKTDTSMVVLRQIPGWFLQPVDVPQSYSRQAVIDLAHLKTVCSISFLTTAEQELP